MTLIERRSRPSVGEPDHPLTPLSTLTIEIRRICLASLRAHEVVLPFELFMAVDDEVEVGTNMLYPAQLNVAFQDNGEKW